MSNHCPPGRAPVVRQMRTLCKRKLIVFILNFETGPCTIVTHLFRHSMANVVLNLLFCSPSLALLTLLALVLGNKAIDGISMQ